MYDIIRGIAVKKMRSAGEEFILRSQFTATNRSLVLFGPSGSGKTLTLQAIAGLLSHDADDIAMVAETVVTYCNGKFVEIRHFQRENTIAKKRWVTDYLCRRSIWW